MQTQNSGQANQAYDLLVVGGGINGAGIARDAVGRGLKVLLCEQHDLAQHTSSSSTKLIHGGLRYLEYYEFKLVRKALQEREVLMRMAPHIISPLCFIMPHDKNQRPAWMVRTGLFMYDHLAKREFLPASQGVWLKHHEAGKPLHSGYKRGFMYSDGWVDDARLVVLNALDAQERGAQVLTRTRCVSATRNDKGWQAVLQREDGSQINITARAMVNAAGPWAAQFAGSIPDAKKSGSLRLIKGSHIVVPRLFDHPYAYIFQNPDKRIIFAIPYQGEFTLIGTTDLEYKGDPGQVKIDDDEVAYLCEMASRYFAKPILREHVVWTYSGVRPLLDDESENASAITRDYVLELDIGQDGKLPALLNVWGGKITTYRKLAEEALALLAAPLANRAPDWTHQACLPGGDLQQAGKMVSSYDVAGFEQKRAQQYPWLPGPLLARYARNYGTRMERMLGDARQLADLGQELTPGLYEREVRYLQQVEWARSAQDILWRRSKLGLWAKPEAVATLQNWLDQAASSSGKEPQ
jgi:glycerol-3-phosphate dehydrogenase